MARPAAETLHIAEDAVIKHWPHGPARVTWGLKQWRVIAPLAWPHIQRRGRDGLADCLWQAQQALPEGVRRPRSSLVNSCCETDTGRDPVGIIAMIVAREPDLLAEARKPPVASAEPAAQQPPELVALPVRPAQREPAPQVQNSAANDTTPPASTLPLPPIASLTKAPDLIQAIAPALAAFRSFLGDAVADALRPSLSDLPKARDPLSADDFRALMREVIRNEVREVVRSAVIEVVGGPPPAPVEPSAPVAAAAPSAPVAAAAPAEPAPVIEQPTKEERPVIQTPPRLEQRRPEPRPHDLESQLASAAKELGLHVKRPFILIVGVHPKVEQELERRYGKQYRMTFKRPDAFHCAADLPATTDVLILCRKTLPGELQQATRRYAIPTVHVGNSVEAVIGAIENVLADAQPGDVDEHTHEPPVMRAQPEKRRYGMPMR